MPRWYRTRKPGGTAQSKTPSQNQKSASSHRVLTFMKPLSQPPCTLLQTRSPLGFRAQPDHCAYPGSDLHSARSSGPVVHLCT
eukprot:2081720-Rhodomonas_salina.1